MPTSLTLVHTDDYGNWVFNSTHPTQGRRFINGRQQLIRYAAESKVEVSEVEPSGVSPLHMLHLVHSPEYVSSVMQHGLCGEWEGSRPDLAHIACTIVQGTLDCLDALHSGSAVTAVNLAGAKHHAQHGHSSGFCVFNDFAIAAQHAISLGHRVAILDIDAHRGDGTEALTASNLDVLTFSIHDVTSFPWEEGENHPSLNVFNRPLAGGSGRVELLDAVNEFTELAKVFTPTLLFVTAGADGHTADPLANLKYEVADYIEVAHLLRTAFPTLPTLIGGAGGYRPDDFTPEIWARFAVAMAV